MSRHLSWAPTTKAASVLPEQGMVSARLNLSTPWPYRPLSVLGTVSQSPTMVRRLAQLWSASGQRCRVSYGECERTRLLTREPPSETLSPRWALRGMRRPWPKTPTNDVAARTCG
jgi:hypothetical protein